MQFHNLRFLLTTLIEQVDKDVKANRKGYLTRHLPVSTALTVALVPIHLKARSLNVPPPTVESGTFLLISTFIMLFLICNTGIIASTLWATRPGIQEEK